MDQDQIPQPDTQELNSSTEQNTFKQSVTTVTPFSKYLALLLFVTLPIVGIMIGYKVGSTEKTLSPTTINIPAAQEEVSRSNIENENQKIVSTFSNTLRPRNDDSFFDFVKLQDDDGYTVNLAKIVSPDSGKETFLAKGLLGGGSIYSGTRKPVISPNGNYLAHPTSVNKTSNVTVSEENKIKLTGDVDGNNLFIQDKNGNSIAVFESLLATSSDARIGIFDWSPDESRILFYLKEEPEGGGPFTEPIYHGMPAGIQFGFYVIDLKAEELLFISGIPALTHETKGPEYDSWYDSDTIIFVQDDIVFEYNLKSGTYSPSSLFGVASAKKYHFHFTGSTKNYSVYTEGYPRYPLDDTVNRTVIRTGNSEKIVKTFSWGEINPNNITLSEDGLFITFITHSKPDTPLVYDIAKGEFVSPLTKQ